jgi:hypothetical protein
MAGVRPFMNQMYTGRNVATRPIPLIVDVSEARAIAAAAADQAPKGSVVNMPSKPRPTAADTIFGVSVPRSAQINGAVYDPSAGIDHTV